MRLHRFYVSSPISSSTFDVADRDLIHQWKHVFRYNVGSQVVVFDGSGTDFQCVITSLRNLGATLSVLKKETKKILTQRNIWLCQAVVKKDNFEMIAEKATELGASHIVPILAEHTEKKKVNMERLKKITVEASEQSGRGNVPEVMPLTTLPELFKSGILPQDKIVFDPHGLPLNQYFETHKLGSTAVFIGPEGGWSEIEINFFKTFNVPILALGPQILRAETAAIASLSLLLL